MNDDQLDQLLLDAGSAFRATHTRTPLHRQRAPRRSFGIVLPVVAGLATLLLVLSIALIHAGKPKAVAPASSVVQLDLSAVTATSASKDYVAVAGTRNAFARPILEVRSRGHLGHVVFRQYTRYAHGGIVCPLLVQDWIVWTDVQNLGQHHARGITALYESNLKTGEVRQESNFAMDTTSGPIPCAVGSNGVFATNVRPDNINVIKVSDQTFQTTVGGPQPRPDGLLNGRDIVYHDSAFLYFAQIVKGTFHTSVRTPVPGISAVATGGDHVVVVSTPQGSRTSQVGSCSKPCTTVDVLATGTAASAPVAGTTFAAWTTPAGLTVTSYAGRPLPGLIGTFFGVSAFGDTLVYASTSAQGQLSLHLRGIS